TPDTHPDACKARNPMDSPVVKSVVAVRLTPRGGRDAVIGRRADGVLLLRVAAPPVDGAANRACRDLLAATLGVRPGRVTLISGETARDKRFSIDGLSDADRDARLAALPAVEA